MQMGKTSAQLDPIPMPAQLLGLASLSPWAVSQLQPHQPMEVFVAAWAVPTRTTFFF
jgi:hypothetical protein